MKTLFSAVTIALMVASPLIAQQQNRGRPAGQQARGGQRPGGGGGGSRPGTPGSSTLETAGLKVGQQLPDVTIHDAKGKPFRMADLKGKHSVIVFGCLT